MFENSHFEAPESRLDAKSEILGELLRLCVCKNRANDKKLFVVDLIL
jgi:hypothetical protein